ncbi:VC0807 family protein [Amycolatopsis jiangsuensis]|uniref:Intracellular septation protein A n=1 Tax=Amycolatopsis jiangsuensis TaxID=1181879 RepID=A0A840IQV9_9PSEU|nr:VC0807 family protein [Amycolatopsis jiangsuensis]MBB4684213.1 intracellular septation protein A [Amycolatopsis jiangsuensis]
MRHALTIDLPSFRNLVTGGGRHLLESTLVPAGLFYLLLTLVSFDSGVIAALCWSVTVLATRLVLRKPVPAVLLLTTALLIARTALGLATGSAFLYFLQPTLQNFVIASLFLVSAPFNKPLLARLAGDFCSFPDTLSGHPGMRRFFQRVSLLWALVFAVNGSVTLLLLAKATVGDFLMVSTAGSYSLVALAIVGSLWWFRRSLRSEGIVLRMGRRPAALPVG